MTQLEQLKAKAREILRPELTNTEGVDKKVLDLIRAVLGDFWQAQQKDLDTLIETVYQAAHSEGVRVADADGAYHSGYLAGKAEVEEAVRKLPRCDCGLSRAFTPNHQD